MEYYTAEKISTINMDIPQKMLNQKRESQISVKKSESVNAVLASFSRAHQNVTELN